MRGTIGVGRMHPASLKSEVSRLAKCHTTPYNLSTNSITDCAIFGNFLLACYLFCSRRCKYKYLALAGIHLGCLVLEEKMTMMMIGGLLWSLDDRFAETVCTIMEMVFSWTGRDAKGIQRGWHCVYCAGDGWFSQLLIREMELLKQGHGTRVVTSYR